MADDEVRRDAALLQRREHRERRRHESGLLDCGVQELLRGGVEAQALEIEAAGLAAALEDGLRGGNRLGDVAPHSLLIRALAGETEGDFLHAFSVHLISALPHVNPAPIPVMSTSWPG